MKRFHSPRDRISPRRAEPCFWCGGSRLAALSSVRRAEERPARAGCDRQSKRAGSGVEESVGKPKLHSTRGRPTGTSTSERHPQGPWAKPARTETDPRPSSPVTRHSARPTDEMQTGQWQLTSRMSSMRALDDLRPDRRRVGGGEVKVGGGGAGAGAAGGAVLLDMVRLGVLGTAVLPPKRGE